MSKYIIEIAKEYEEYFKGILICGIAEEKFAVDVIAKEDLEELTADYINEHFGDLQDTAYQKGFEDGKWKSEDGCTGCKYEGKTGEHLPCDYCMNNFKNQWTAKDDEIEVGDEVVDSSGEKGLVVSDGNKCSDTIWLLINGYRVPQSVCKEDYTKTGRHFDIGKILEDMKA